MNWRFLCVVLGMALTGANVARAQDVDSTDSAVWEKVRTSLFADAQVETADNVIALVTPKRAEDAAIVPVAIQSHSPQSKERFIEKIWLIVDNNPSPIAAVFDFTLESGRADIET